MPMIEEMQSAGTWLFRWRSYLPLITFALILAAVGRFHYPFGSHGWDQIWELTCLGVSLAGLFIRVLTVGCTPRGTSGRNTRRQVAESLNTDGLYSMVRNPLYLGNFLVGIGPVLVLRVGWVPVIYTLLFMLYYERIVFAEEMFLREKFGPAYLEWAARTPAFFPLIFNWQPPRQRFNWRQVLRREHQTLFLVICVFYLVELAGEWHLGHELFADGLWNGLALTGLFLFGAIRWVRNHTKLLRDPAAAA